MFEYEYPIEFNPDYMEKYDYWQEEYQVDHFILSSYTEDGYDLERNLEISWYSVDIKRHYNFNLIYGSI